MKEIEIIEGNRLIAEFLGYKEGFPHKIDQYGYVQTVEGYKIEFNDVAVEDLKYHYSPDWLIPVVDKIESIEDPYQGRFGVHIYSNNCTIQSTNFRPDEKSSNPPYYFNSVYGLTKIEAVWLAVVEFIKYHNLCQKQG